MPKYQRTLAVSIVPALIACALAAALVLASSRSHAEPQPALDRALVERLVRAEETQAHQLEALTRAVERAGERCGH